MRKIKEKNDTIISGFLKAHREKKIWHRIMGSLSAIVALATIYLLIFPAVTLERVPLCGNEEHVHTEECFQQTPEGETGQPEQTPQEPDNENSENNEADLVSVEEEPDNDSGETETDFQEPTESNETVQLPAEDILESGQDTPDMTDTQDTPEDTIQLLNLEAGDNVISTEPMTLEDKYITNAVMYYRLQGSENWNMITEETRDIPGNASIRLNITYDNIMISDLLAAGGKLIYQLPDILRNPEVTADILSGSEAVATLVADKLTGKITITFREDWLNSKLESGDKILNGDFYVDTEIKISSPEENEPAVLVIGDVTIRLYLESDLVAKYGDIAIQKATGSITEEADGDYLDYTITVTAGEDGCPQVKVVDHFPQNQQYIEAYAGVTGSEALISTIDSMTEEGAPAGSEGKVYLGNANSQDEIPAPAGENVTLPGILVWNIGEMQPYEERTLHYKVKLYDSYTGISAKSTIQNDADVYAGTTLRDSDTSSFVPKATATLKKERDWTKNADGTYTITYRITMKANESNSYTLDNVKIDDAFENLNDAQKACMNYETESFCIYKGDMSSEANRTDLPENPHSTQSDPAANPVLDSENMRFTAYIGELAPGEQKILVYKVTMTEEIFVAFGNKDVVVNNRASMKSDDTRPDGNVQWNAWTCYTTVTRKVWSRKIAGEKLENAMEISIGGSDKVYEQSGTAITGKGSFTIPAGSYEYQVLANETGDWDLSSASLQDAFGSQYMEFVGYVRVDAYNMTDKSKPSGWMTDTQAAGYFTGTPAKTVWVKIDQDKSFAFTPKDIGLDGEYAYKLTYYAKPVEIDSSTKVLVSNYFTIAGEAGINGKTYILTGIEASANLLVEGSDSFGVEKLGWYYEEPQTTKGPMRYGALYWVIKVDGNKVPQGFKLLDDSRISSPEHYIWNDLDSNGTTNELSLMCYTGNFGEGSITDYPDLEAALATGKLTEVDSSNYSCSKYGTDRPNRTLLMTFNNDVPLSGNNSMYIVLKTALQKIPSAKRDIFNFTNKVQMTLDGSTNWLDCNTATITLRGSENIFKELNRVFTWDGETAQIITKTSGGSSSQALDTSQLENGTYIAWEIQVNHEGYLNGRYRIRDTIPEGTEVAYVRIWWKGASLTNDTLPVVQKLSLSELGEGWEEHINTMSSTNLGTCTTYYYTNGQEVIWDISPLTAGKVADQYAVEFQIVCKVTDPDVLLGAEEKTYTNQVSVLNEGGIDIGRDSNSVTFQRTSMWKGKQQETADKKFVSGEYPFEITVNEIGEDLLPGADKITVVDELSDTLVLDPTTLEVKNTKTGEIIENWTSSIETRESSSGKKTILKLVIPDNLPITITYTTRINAAPGAYVNIENNAHWEGYTTPASSSVQITNYRYLAGGSAGTGALPSVKVIKLDQSNTSQFLSGAKFTLQKVKEQDGNFVPEGEIWEGVTGQDGSLVFGKVSGQDMDYNTVYCLKEIEAPTGYLLNDTPHYFVIAKSISSDSMNPVYPDYPDGVDAVYYLGAQYTYQAYNKSAMTYRLPDTGGTGREIYIAGGWGLAASAAMLLYLNNRKNKRKTR